jgi:transcriptional regulator with XRE-family HTH domain
VVHLHTNADPLMRLRYDWCVDAPPGDEAEAALVTFRTRLRTTIAELGLSRTAFAEAAGVDRSTISQLLSASNRRLPRVETLVAIARHAQVSLDWLLGLSAEGPVRADIVSEQPRIEPGSRTPEDERLAAWLAEAAGTKIRYIPSTLPDLFKTDAVIRHEVGRSDATSPEQQMEVAAARLATSRSLGTDMECANSVQALEGFARGEGLWRTLDRRRRVHQLDHMIELVEELYPSVRWFLFDARERYAAPVTIYGTRRAALYLGQQYLVFTAAEPIRALIAAFDDLVRVATVQPTEVTRLLRRLREELTAA